MRLIDADALIENTKNDPVGKTLITHYNLDGFIKSQPTVNAAPERTGTWSEEYHPENDLFLRRIYRCSACNGWNTYGFPRYCPDCGAKMLNATALTREADNE